MRYLSILDGIIGYSCDICEKDCKEGHIEMSPICHHVEEMDGMGRRRSNRGAPASGRPWLSRMGP